MPILNKVKVYIDEPKPIMEPSIDKPNIENPLQELTIVHHSISAAVLLLKNYRNGHSENNDRILSTNNTDICASATKTSSKQFVAVSQAIQLIQNSLENIIHQSSDQLRNKNIDSKTATKRFSMNAENAMKTVLRSLHSKISWCKINIQTFLEFYRLNPRNADKLMQLHSNTYLKSLSRLKHIAEEIVNERIYYHQFLKKFSHKIIEEDPTAFQHFYKTVMIHFMTSISSLALERMSSGISNQFLNLEQLRISSQDESDLNDNNNFKHPDTHQESKSVLDKKIQEMVEYQIRTISSIATLFVPHIDNLTQEFHINLLKEAKKNEVICVYEMDALKDVLAVLDDGPVHSSWVKVCKTVSTSPAKSESNNHDQINGLRTDTSQPLNSKAKKASDKLKLNEDNEIAILNLISSMHSSPDKWHKSLIKLIDLWDKKLSFVFNKQLNSHKKEATNILKNTHSVLFSTFKFQYMDIHFLEESTNKFISDIKLEQKKILTMLNSSINPRSSVSGIPILSPIDLAGQKGTSPHAKSLSNIKLQNLRSTKLISKWSIEFVQYYERTLKCYRILIDQNAKQLNHKIFQDQKYTVMEFIVRNFFDEVQSALESSEQTVHELSKRLDLQTEGFKRTIQDSGAKMKVTMALLFKLMKDALDEYGTFIYTCSNHLDDFFTRKIDIIKINLTQIQHPLKEFLSIRGTPLVVDDIPHISISEEYIKNDKPTIKNNVIEPKPAVKVLKLFPEIVNPPSHHVRQGKGSSSKQGRKSNKRSDLTLVGCEDGLNLKCQNDPKNLGFIEKYIHASMKETAVPKWAEIDVN